jgi:hypothetical protein
MRAKRHKKVKTSQKIIIIGSILTIAISAYLLPKMIVSLSEYIASRIGKLDDHTVLVHLVALNIFYLVCQSLVWTVKIGLSFLRDKDDE